MTDKNVSPVVVAVDTRTYNPYQFASEMLDGALANSSTLEQFAAYGTVEATAKAIAKFHFDNGLEIVDFDGEEFGQDWLAGKLEDVINVSVQDNTSLYLDARYQFLTTHPAGQKLGWREALEVMAQELALLDGGLSEEGHPVYVFEGDKFEFDTNSKEFFTL